VLATAPLLGSLRLVAEAGIGAIRTKSLAQTSYWIGTPRQPDVIRLAPIPLHTSYRDLWGTAGILRDVIASGDYRSFADARDLVA
jgi:kynureninase